MHRHSIIGRGKIGRGNCTWPSWELKIDCNIGRMQQRRLQTPGLVIVIRGLVFSNAIAQTMGIAKLQGSQLEKFVYSTCKRLPFLAASLTFIEHKLIHLEP